MRSFRLSLKLIFLVCITSCSFTFNVPSPLPLVLFSDNTAFYWGPVTEEGVTKLLHKVKSQTTKQLFIDSGGGSSEAGLRAGEYISRNDVSVVVVGRCYSSCANYFFLPSKDRKMLNYAKIGLHGGEQSYEIMRQDLHDTLPPAYRDYYKELISSPEQKAKLQNEIKLLKDAGFDPDIILHSAKKTLFGATNFEVGQDNKYNLPAKTFKLEARVNSKYEVWFPKLSDFPRWGIQIGESSFSEIPFLFRIFLRQGQVDRLDVSNE